MDFAFDESTEAYRRAVRDFAAAKLAPHYQDGDRTGRARPELRDELARLGLLGLRVPAEAGGQRADAVTTGVALEELARADLNAAYVVLLCALVADILDGASAPAAALEAVASGAQLPSLALTEPGHGSDAASLTLRAERAGDGWRLTGEKASVSLGAQADTAVVFARTGAAGPHGVSAFYVSLRRDGVEREPYRDLGSRAVGRASLRFEGLAVDRAALLGAEGEGFARVMRGFDSSRAWIGLMCVACAQASIDEALEWARRREAFGEPIGRFQGIAFPLVEHATRLRAARLLCYEALWRRDRGDDPTVVANMAKWWAPQVAVDAAHAALLTFGHAGYSEDLPLGQRIRDLIGLEIGDGTAQIAKLVVARRLLGREFAP